MVSKQRPKAARISGGRLITTLAVFALMAGVATVPTSGQSPAAQSELALHVARADACSRLRERIAALQLSADRTIGDLMETDAAMVRFVRQTAAAARPAGEPVQYSDGSFDATVDLSLADIERKFFTADGVIDIDGFPAAGSPGWLADINKAASIRVVGVGYPPARAFDFPNGASAAPVWQAVEPAGQRITAQAAMLDADRQLLDQLARVELQRGVPLSGLCNLNDEFRQRCDDAIEAAIERKLTFSLDLSCVAESALAGHALAPILKQLHERAGHLSPLRAPDWKAISAALNETRIATTGFAFVPPAYRENTRPDIAGIPAPAWAADTLTVTQPADSSAAVATLVARQQLAAKIDELPLGDGLTVGDIVIRHNAIAPDLSAYLFSVQPLAVTAPADNIAAAKTITLAAPLERLWLLVARELSADELRAVTAAAAAANRPDVEPQPDPG